MSKLTKVGIVLGGYLLACLFAWGATSLYQLFTQDMAAQASAGMYAFGDGLLFLGMCGVAGLFPTLLAVYFLFKK